MKGIAKRAKAPKTLITVSERLRPGNSELIKVLKIQSDTTTPNTQSTCFSLGDIGPNLSSSESITFWEALNFKPLVENIKWTKTKYIIAINATEKGSPIIIHFTNEI